MDACIICDVCLKNFEEEEGDKSPRVLTCGHSFCTQICFMEIAYLGVHGWCLQFSDKLFFVEYY